MEGRKGRGREGRGEGNAPNFVRRFGGIEAPGCLVGELESYNENPPQDKIWGNEKK